MTTPSTSAQGPVPSIPLSVDEATAFLTMCSDYFERRPTGGEDAAHWANVSNARMCRKIAAMLTASPPPAASPASPSGVREAWSFLQDRLLEFEQEIGSGDEEREWAGHVHPAMSRFNTLVASLSSDAGPTGDAVAWRVRPTGDKVWHLSHEPPRMGYEGVPLYAHPAPATVGIGDGPSLGTQLNNAALTIRKLSALLRRYRDETPLGHQPHMIAAEVDAALAPATEGRKG